MTATFTSPFYPAPPFYTGSATVDVVPFTYPVALNGRPYMLDLGSGQLQRGFEPRIRESVDQGGLPGEASVSPEGMWRRSQATWNFGAGQRWADNVESIPGRFYESVNVDVWTDGQLRLLNGVSFSSLSSGVTSARLISDGVRLYLTSGANITYYTDIENSATSITGEGAEPVLAAATNGFHTWFSQGTAGLYRTVRGSDAATQVLTSTVGNVGFVANRLLVSAGNSLYDCTSLAYGSAGVLPTALFTHANTDFVWVGFANSGTHIYAAGVSGGRSLIYKITITAEGTALAAPSVALELPPGEVVTALDDFPGGFILIGTSRGPRLAQGDGGGDLTVGALIDTGSPVRQFVADKSFVYFSWEANHPSGSAGVGRIDLRRFTAPLTPAYASDFNHGDSNPGDASSLSLALFDGRLVIVGVSSAGARLTVQHDVEPFPSGWLETGSWVWGVPDPKIVSKVDVRTDPLPQRDGVTVGVSFDLGGLETSQCVAAAGSSFLKFHPQQRNSFRTDFRLNLTKSDNNVSPVVTRFNARAFVSPPRSQVLRVPLLLHHRIMVDGFEADQDVGFELLALRGLVASPRVVRYQEGFESFSVLVEDVLWIPRHEQVGAGKWDGTAVVTMRTIDL
jgi:hypothetical protein